MPCEGLAFVFLRVSSLIPPLDSETRDIPLSLKAAAADRVSYSKVFLVYLSIVLVWSLSGVRARF